MNSLIKTPITSLDQAKRYIDFIETQYIYHPDDCATTIINRETEERIYTDPVAKMINQRNEEIFDYFDDLYQYILDLREFKDNYKVTN